MANQVLTFGYFASPVPSNAGVLHAKSVSSESVAPVAAGLKASLIQWVVSHMSRVSL